VKLRILYACTECRRLFEGDGYNLRAMFGKRAVCDECTAKAKE
jgi:DNA-directed RNA polymerase subunit RPC12/RpoP